jgi:hypothetical protein
MMCPQTQDFSPKISNFYLSHPLGTGHGIKWTETSLDAEEYNPQNDVGVQSGR